MIHPGLRKAIKDVLKKEALRRCEIADREPDGIILGTNRRNALRSLPEDAFLPIYNQVKQYGITESQLKLFIKYACEELDESLAGGFVNPNRPFMWEERI